MTQFLLLPAAAAAGVYYWWSQAKNYNTAATRARASELVAEKFGVGLYTLKNTESTGAGTFYVYTIAGKAVKATILSDRSGVRFV